MKLTEALDADQEPPVHLRIIMAVDSGKVNMVYLWFINTC